MGNTPKYLKQLCGQKIFTYMGCAEIVMPENYIALFNVPERKQAVKIIKNVDIVLKNTTDVIKHNGTIPEKKVSAFAKASSGGNKYFILSSDCKRKEILCHGCLYRMR